MSSLPHNHKIKPQKYKHVEQLFRIPEIRFSHHRRRSNSLPSSPPPTPPQNQNPSLDMAQRSATARSKAEKLSVPSSSFPASQKILRKPSNPFHNLFPGPKIGTAAINNRHTYLSYSERALSTSSLPMQQHSIDQHMIPLIPPQTSSQRGSNTPMNTLTPAEQALKILQDKHAIVLAENAELRASLAAEREFTAKLCCYLQEYHESQGRINPEKGNINSVFYRDLKDEQGNILVPSEVASLETTCVLLPGEVKNDGWRGGDEKKMGLGGNEGDNEVIEIGRSKEEEELDVIKRRNKEEQEDEEDERRWIRKLHYARSFDSQRA